MSENRENIHKGHRQRVKETFYKVGLDGMSDHNVLEMLLFFGIPYKDTNEIAHRLMETFGSFSGVLRADAESLRKVKGMTDNAACLISMLLPVYRRYFEDLDLKCPQLLTAEDIVNYIKPKFIDTKSERVFLLCFGVNHSLIATRLLCEGGLTKASFNMRAVASAVLETNPLSVVLVHNHQNEISMPSVNDIDTTCKVFEFLKPMGIALTDHIILSTSGFTSMARYPKFSDCFISYD